jgi:hypothetical protein
LWTRILTVGLAIMAAAFTMAMAFVVVVWIWWQVEPSGDQRSRGINALWAAHTWVGDAHSDEEYRAFAELLTQHEISDLYAHAGPLEAHGGVSEDRFAYAQEFLDAMELYAPSVRVHAYLGQIEERGGGILDLDDDGVRGEIVRTAEGFLQLGFDGIHYDIEPVYPGDERFLNLLDRTSVVTQRHHALLSVALEQTEFSRPTGAILGFVWPSYHNPTMTFLEDVAYRVDQIAIMTYDSHLPTESLFGAHMAMQTERVVEAIGDEVTVFMGVPTHDGSPLQRYSWAENVSTGVRGVRKGLDRVDDEESHNVGIAIFAEWTTSDDEWEAYHREWIVE